MSICGFNVICISNGWQHDRLLLADSVFLSAQVIIDVPLQWHFKIDRVGTRVRVLEALAFLVMVICSWLDLRHLRQLVSVGMFW